MKRSLIVKIAMISLAAYALFLTLALVLAVSVGPFQESFRLWTQIKVLETQLKNNDEERERLGAEKNRLLEAIKNLQTSLTTARETIRTLNKLVKDPEMAQKLVEANLLAEKLGQERAVLIEKINELREKVEACSP